MSVNGTNLNNKKIKLSDFYNHKDKKIFYIDGIDVDKILVPKKYRMVKIFHSNTLLGIMIMILLDYYF